MTIMTPKYPKRIELFYNPIANKYKPTYRVNTMFYSNFIKERFIEKMTTKYIIGIGLSNPISYMHTPITKKSDTLVLIDALAAVITLMTAKTP